jgi:hypothetical protein
VLLRGTSSRSPEFSGRGWLPQRHVDARASRDGIVRDSHERGAGSTRQLTLDTNGSRAHVRARVWWHHRLRASVDVDGRYDVWAPRCWAAVPPSRRILRCCLSYPMTAGTLEPSEPLLSRARKRLVSPQDASRGRCAMRRRSQGSPRVASNHSDLLADTHAPGNPSCPQALRVTRALAAVR